MAFRGGQSSAKTHALINREFAVKLSRVRQTVLAGSLVLFPLLILMYWVFYPAYGILDSADALRAIARAPSRTAMSDVFVFTGAFLAAPATLAMMRVLDTRSPKLATIGGALHLVGWIAIIGVVMGDVVAVQIAAGGALTNEVVQLDQRIMSSAPVIALNVIATLHVIGGIMLGAALWRTRVVPLWAGIAATFAQPIHFASNIAGIFWVDALTWIALAAAYGTVAAVVLRESEDADVVRPSIERGTGAAMGATA